MAKSIPKIAYREAVTLDIEVMSIAQMSQRLVQSKDHDPFATHKIQFYLMIIVTEGAYTHYLDFNRYTLKPGSILFVAKEQVQHFTQAIHKTKGFAVILNHQYLENEYLGSSEIGLNRLYNYHLESPVIHQDQMAEDSLLPLAQELHNEYYLKNSFGKSEVLRSLLHALLVKAERVKDQNAQTTVSQQWLNHFSSFTLLLHNQHTKTRNAQDYADKLYISYKLLNDVVKALTLKTAKAFIDDFVCMEIKRLLISTSLSVKEISFKTGFDEPANMIKFFKKQAETTPAQFRKNML
ncbi:helix-turn-helix domain-containing protein [Gilvibacter sediminis]|uniref:helix-turn-helix domain-containing protein n=1 Tax=Gilvibacter sediminis TaxID=379071 RepID=UPI00234FC1F8|nr:helix-turn-helix domain-containing protein [Gilvibacter sediminis]MDC7998308.1 helix-turn-helix transcriptional regulator [Gilvibacter sediminis]